MLVMLEMQLIERHQRVRGHLLSDSTLQTRLFGGKWILMECTVYTALISYLKPTKDMVFIIAYN